MYLNLNLTPLTHSLFYSLCYLLPLNFYLAIMGIHLPEKSSPPECQYNIELNQEQYLQYFYSIDIFVII